MIVLVVNLRMRAGTEELTKQYMRNMQEHTRKEPGCRLYVGHQSLEDPLLFCFYEQYDDQAALDAHAKVNAARAPMPAGLRSGGGEREDYEYNRVR